MIEIHNGTTDQKKAFWGYGEWIEEPDEVEWEYKGTKCQIVRNMQTIEDSILGLGHLCGYVYIPLDHQWAKLEKETDIPCEIHGGLTYHLLTDEGLKIGFDCAHLYDETPFTPEKMLKFQMEYIKKENPNYLSDSTYISARTNLEKFEAIGCNSSRLLWHPKTYKNIDFVRKECESLVDQMIEANHPA